MTNSDGKAKFESKKEWRIEALMRHEAEIFSWNCCVYKEGFETYLTANGGDHEFVVVAIISVLSSKKEILLSSNNISAPKSGISKKIVTINLKDVTDVNIQSEQKQKFLNIVYQNGKLTIPQSMLPNKKLFEELTELVVSRING